MTHEFMLAISKYLTFLQSDYLAHGGQGLDGWEADKPGLNVVRILHVTYQHNGDINQRSAHSFVVLKDFEKGGKKFLAGDILLTSSWKAPAWNKARGNIFSGYGSASWTGAGYIR